MTTWITCFLRAMKNNSHWLFRCRLPATGILGNSRVCLGRNTDVGVHWRANATCFSFRCPDIMHEVSYSFPMTISPGKCVGTVMRVATNSTMRNSREQD